MNQKTVVTSSDPNDLRLAAELYLSNELDADSEQLFVERLDETLVAQCLTEAMALHAVGVEMAVGAEISVPVAARQSAVTQSAVTQSASARTGWNAWTVLVITASIAVCCVWYFQGRASTEADQTQRVAELWASVNAAALDATEAVAVVPNEPGSSESSEVPHAGGTDLASDSDLPNDADSNGGFGPEDDLAPPSWLVAAMLSVGESDSGDSTIDDEKDLP